MENYILNRYDKDENGNLIIKIHTKNIIYQKRFKRKTRRISF